MLWQSYTQVDRAVRNILFFWQGWNVMNGRPVCFVQQTVFGLPAVWRLCFQFVMNGVC